MIGKIVSGSFSEGLDCLLQSYQQDVCGGAFLIVQTPLGKLFSIVTDVTASVTDYDVPMAHLSKTVSEVVSQKTTKYYAKLNPILFLNQKDQISNFCPMPLMGSEVYFPDPDIFEKIFGKEDFSKSNPFLEIGTTRAGGKIALSYKAFVERSNGVFGKTGSGKTFLSRILLSGLIRSGVANTLIFDMHGEYGLSARSEGGEDFVPGLKALFPEKVSIFSLDPQATRQRGCNPDVEVLLDLSDITVEDIISLQTELNLHPTAIEAASLLSHNFGKDWLIRLLQEGVVLKDLASQIGAHTESLSALYRKLKRLQNLPFIKKEHHANSTINISAVLIEHLNKGLNVILEFGRQSSSLAYLLVSGIMTRKIHKEYVKKTEKYLATQEVALKPLNLVIVIEEAHNFLGPSLAKQTIFGTIAREMRKYFVSLFVIDQRPSGICDEILSQLGSKFVTRIDDEKDISSLTSGANPKFGLRNMLANLEQAGQGVFWGHATRVPVAFFVRRYDKKFYQAISFVKDSRNVQDKIADIFK